MSTDLPKLKEWHQALNEQLVSRINDHCARMSSLEKEYEAKFNQLLHDKEQQKLHLQQSYNDNISQIYTLFKQIGIIVQHVPHVANGNNVIIEIQSSDNSSSMLDRKPNAVAILIDNNNGPIIANLLTPQEPTLKPKEIKVENSTNSNIDFGNLLSSLLLSKMPNNFELQHGDAKNIKQCSDKNATKDEENDEDDEDDEENADDDKLSRGFSWSCSMSSLPSAPYMSASLFSNGSKHRQCYVCDKEFSDLIAWNEHASYHAKVHKQCSYCSKKFVNRSNVLIHTRIHTGEKPYHCKYCPMKFNAETSCIRHERVHTGERPYACSYCHKRFTQSNDRKAHERIHTGDKPFPCRYCSKKCITSSSRLVHERIHTGFRPYQCQFCKQRFARKNLCQLHEREKCAKK